ncbi:MAG: response regulator [Janthinobacterium lividum]
MSIEPAAHASQGAALTNPRHAGAEVEHPAACMAGTKTLPHAGAPVAEHIIKLDHAGPVPALAQPFPEGMRRTALQFAPRRQNILIVDDEPRNRLLLDAMLKPEGYLTFTAANADETLAVLARYPIDLILLDYMMPGMNGCELTLLLKADPHTRKIPIIMVTALDDRSAKLAGLNAGAEEFLSKPVERSELWVRVRNLLRLKEYSDLLESNNQTLERKVAERTATLRESYIEAIFTMTRAAEFKDEDTGTHVRRISDYCRYLATDLNMDRTFIDCIYYASPMHDIGKIGIPDHILLKAGEHDAAESAVMRSHSTLGAAIIGESDSPYMIMGAQIARSHHERWDGSGYPLGLRGDSIPISARIMAICDVYDALRSRRPYKSAISHADTTRIILEGDGRTLPGHFDPLVLAAFARCAPRFEKIFDACIETADGAAAAPLEEDALPQVREPAP